MALATEQQLLEVLDTIPDPELGISIVELGLIYDLAIHDEEVRITMTMTTPACPLHAYLREQVEQAVRKHFPEIKRVEINLVFDPPWHPMLMSPQARRRLGWPE